MLREIFENKERKQGIIKYVITILIVTILMFVFVGQAVKESKVEKKVIFTENTKFDYEVSLKENEFFKEEVLEKDNQYIASLIEKIDADFTYELESDAKDEVYLYDYKIMAEVEVEDELSHKTIYLDSEEIKSVTGKSFNSKDKLKINESMQIDYTEYNEKMTRFVNTYDLENVDSYVNLSLYVYIKTSKQDDAEYLKNPVMTLKIPLTTNTIAIEIMSNVKENIEGLEKGITKLWADRKFFIISIACLIVYITLIIKMLIFIRDTRTQESTYKMKLRKILGEYGSYIQKISKQFNFEGFQAIELETFESIVQIRDLVQAPILMLQREDEAHFMVPTKSGFIYMFELNSGVKKARIDAPAATRENKEETKA